MLIKSAEFVKSCPGLRDCLPPEKPEYAFLGRSNVGKSSLINMITERKGMAKTSGKPGKTRLINYFDINGEWYLVDLPGYGYASVSRKERASWDKMIRAYLKGRNNLMTTFLLVDSRLTPQTIDIDYINWFGENQLPFVILFTKTDKLTNTEAKRNLDQFKSALKEHWEELPVVITTSAVEHRGKDEVLDYIENTNTLFDRGLFQHN